MNRPLRIGDVVCIREEAVEAVLHEGNGAVESHRRCRIVDVADNGPRRVFHLEVPWQDKPVFVWPSEVHLADGAAEKLYARKGKFHAELEAEVQAARAARARRCPKRKRAKP